MVANEEKVKTRQNEIKKNIQGTNSDKKKTGLKSKILNRRKK